MDSVGGGTDPQHLAVGLLRSDSQGREIGELPRDKLRLGLHYALCELDHSGAEAAVTVEQQDRLVKHDVLISEEWSSG